KHAALIGALWGTGHTLTILAVGSAILLFGWVIPARVGLSMEFSVAVMLILLGIMNLTGFLQWINQRFSRPADGGKDEHGHSHERGESPPAPGANHTFLHWLDRHFGGLGLYQLARPLLIGIVHGLAGSAAVALLVLATIRDPRWAVVYLLV